jgi:hypothetical protein
VRRERVRRVTLHASQPRGINGHGAMQEMVVAGMETQDTMYIGFHFDGNVQHIGHCRVCPFHCERNETISSTPTEVKSFFNFSDPLNHLYEK